MKKVIMNIEVTVEDQGDGFAITSQRTKPQVEGLEVESIHDLLKSDQETFIAETIAMRLHEMMKTVKDLVGKTIEKAADEGNEMFHVAHAIGGAADDIADRIAEKVAAERRGSEDAPREASETGTGKAD